MNFNKKKGLTLVESLVSILLLSTLVGGILGAFFISRTCTVRAKHRMVAMNLVREWMEKEAGKGYGGGAYESFDPDNDATQVIDGVTYAISRYPNPAVTSYEGGITGVPYKTVGFEVTWNEPIYNQVGAIVCSERSVTYIARH